MSFFREELNRLRDAGLYRTIKTIEPAENGYVYVDGHKALLLCSNNYLGLAGRPELVDAAAAAAHRYGAGSGAARLVSGTMGLHIRLEQRIAAFKRSESALVFNSGYAANIGIITALAGKGDLIFSDRLNHASILDGALLSRARLIRYPHNDVRALRRLLEEHQTSGRRLIVTDGVFSMDGDIAHLAELVRLKKEFGALLMVDDAHGTGVIGAGGRGTAELLGVAGEIDVQMGTLGKGLGSFGAYVAGSDDLIDYLRNGARSFIFSTSLPPAVLAPSIVALDIVESEDGEELRRRLENHRLAFSSQLEEAGFDTMNSTSQIIPILVGEAELTMLFSRLLLENGIFVQGIRPPTVPAGSCRLRCTLMATHTDDALAEAAAKIIEVGRGLGVIR